jgi:tetratricopeptide (TPR) repeat protein
MTTQSNRWTVQQASLTAALCFVVGGAIGFVAHGPAAPVTVAKAPAAMAASAPEPSSMAPPISTPAPSPEQLKAAGSKAAIPVLDQLKKEPKNFKLLVQAGEMYFHHGAFAEASGYYKRALEVEDNPLVRNQYANALFNQGDADGALKQYGQVLEKKPTNDIALFNIGMIRFTAKKDSKGAVESWQKLLKAYPDHPQRERVQALIDKAQKQQS